MGSRPWRCYREINKMAYTRIAKRKQRRNYIRAAPGITVRRWRMGEPNRMYDLEVTLVCDVNMQIRQGALESARMAANRPLAAKVDKRNYFLRLKVFPHHIIRENKMLTGAGADRLQTGMSRSFGKKIDRAARVKKGTALMEARIFEKDLPYLKLGFKMAQYKLPCACSIKVNKFDKTKLDRVYTLSELEERDARKKQGLGKQPEAEVVEETPEKEGAETAPEKTPTKRNKRK